jgi:hypothetical protein
MRPALQREHGARDELALAQIATVGQGDLATGEIDERGKSHHRRQGPDLAL